MAESTEKLEAARKKKEKEKRTEEEEEKKRRVLPLTPRDRHTRKPRIAATVLAARRLRLQRSPRVP